MTTSSNKENTTCNGVNTNSSKIESFFKLNELQSDSLIRKKFKFELTPTNEITSKNLSSNNLLNDSTPVSTLNLKYSNSIPYFLPSNNSKSPLSADQMFSIKKPSAKSNSNLFDAPKNTAVLRNKPETRAQSQEEILEEFKNSLNELIKASKWTTKNEPSHLPVYNKSKTKSLSIYGTTLDLDENQENIEKNSLLKKSTTLINHGYNDLATNLDKLNTSLFVQPMKTPQGNIDSIGSILLLLFFFFFFKVFL